MGENCKNRYILNNKGVHANQLYIILRAGDENKEEKRGRGRDRGGEQGRRIFILMYRNHHFYCRHHHHQHRNSNDENLFF